MLRPEESMLETNIYYWIITKKSLKKWINSRWKYRKNIVHIWHNHLTVKKNYIILAEKSMEPEITVLNKVIQTQKFK